jgi:hypothetical protein
MRIGFNPTHKKIKFIKSKKLKEKIEKELKFTLPG